MSSGRQNWGRAVEVLRAICGSAGQLFAGRQQALGGGVDKSVGFTPFLSQFLRALFHTNFSELLSVNGPVLPTINNPYNCINKLNKFNVVAWVGEEAI